VTICAPLLSILTSSPAAEPTIRVPSGPWRMMVRSISGCWTAKARLNVEKIAAAGTQAIAAATIWILTLSRAARLSTT
jgi:hypothetical protein